MKSTFRFYLRYILFFLCIQMVFNIIFLLVYHDLAREVGIWDRILALVYGLKLDISLTGYILGLPTLVLILYSIFRNGLLRKIISVYTFLIITGLVLAYFTNLIIYKYWKFPIDRTIFDYISTPGEMIASLSLFRLIINIGLIVLSIYLLYFQVYLKWAVKPLSGTWKRSWTGAALFLLILPALILPIRGGLSTSPVQTGSVYFHEKTFINHAAINPVWNLFYTLVEGESLTQEIHFYEEQTVREIMDDLYVSGDAGLHVLNSRSPNIILILLESVAQPVITELGGDGTAAPNFNRLIKEGLFFNKTFSSGTMTDRALAAVLGGYPSIPGTCIIYYEDKAQKLPNLNLELKSAGYSSAFLYGGDIDFAHIKSFIVMSGFDNIIEDKDFSRKIPRSSWGVPDHYLFDRMLEVTDQASSPFFHVLLTLSSHTPFDVPMEPVFHGSGNIEKYRNSVYYTDHSLGEFIKTAKTRDWWDQTIIVLMADHGCRMGDIMAHEKRRFSIPMLWLGGALEARDTVITKYGSQTDFPATLLNQLDLSGDKFRFSKDLLSEHTRSFAFYTFNDGVGFIDDSSTTIYSLVTGEYLMNENSGPEVKKDPTLAYLQCLLDDFNKK